MDKLKEIVNQAMLDKPIAVSEYVNDIMKAKVMTLLADKKKEVATALFQGK